MTMHHAQTKPQTRYILKIAGGVAGGLLILFIGIGIGAYPQEKRLQEQYSKTDPAPCTMQVSTNTAPPIMEVIIPFPSEDSYKADYYDGALHVIPFIP